MESLASSIQQKKQDKYGQNGVQINYFVHEQLVVIINQWESMLFNYVWFFCVALCFWFILQTAARPGTALVQRFRRKKRNSWGRRLRQHACPRGRGCCFSWHHPGCRVSFMAMGQYGLTNTCRLCSWQSAFYLIFKIFPYLLITLSYITWIITYTSSFSPHRIGHSFKEKKVSFWQSPASPSAERRRRDSSQRNATALAVALLLLQTTERRRHKWLTGRL